MMTEISEWSVPAGAGGWTTTFGEWHETGGEIVVTAACRLEFVLSEGGAKGVCITIEDLRGSQRVGIEFDDVFFHLGAENDPGLKIELMNRVIAASPLGAIRCDQPAQFVCERSSSAFRMRAPDGVCLETQDPNPRFAIKALALHLPKGTRFRALKLAASNPVPPAHVGACPSKLELSFCMDFFDDLILNPWTKETFRECMAWFQKHNFRRMYFIDHFGQHGGWWRRAGNKQRFPKHQEYIDQTFQNVGDYLPAAVSAAKEAGLEAIAVMKPFEAAAFYSTPHPAPGDGPNRGIRSLGGWNQWATDFAAQNPHLRLERNMANIPPDLATRKVAAIVLKAHPDVAGTLDPTRLRLWTSRDNGTYEQVPPDQLRIECNGGQQSSVTIRGFNPDGRFWALDYHPPGDRPVFGNSFDELVELYDTENRRLPITFSNTINPPSTDFTKTGFAMDLGSVSRDLFWLDRGRPLGVAVGVEQFLQGALCPAYPEVRAWWLEQVDQCLAAGVDGIDFRVSAHNRTFHWDAYGFNQPLVDAFKARHGIDIREQAFDRRDLRILTGEFYTDFLREAHRAIKAAGKSMHLHLELGFQEPDQSGDLEIHFDWRQWLRDGLADEVCIKNIRCMQSPVAQEFSDFARRNGVAKIHFNPSMNILIGHPSPRRFFDAVIEDTLQGRANGFILYETAAILSALPDHSIHAKLPWVVETLAQLGVTENDG